jgi:hypothetical protein
MTSQTLKKYLWTTNRCSICMVDIKPGNIGGTQGTLGTLEITLCKQCSDGISNMIKGTK